MMKMLKIDKKDLKLLSVLDMDARLPIPALAKKIGVSRQLAEYRFKRLVSEKVILHAMAVYDQRTFGQNIYRVLFQLYQSSEKIVEAFVHYLIEEYHIMWAAKLGGGWDLVVNFVAPDIQTFDEQFMRIARDYENLIQQYHILTYVSITDCHRGYLLAKKEQRTFVHLQNGSLLHLDEKDRKLLTLLAENCRENNITLGKKVGLTGNAVRYRIKQYEAQGLLLGYRLFIDASLLGYQNHLVLLTVNNLTEKNGKRLQEYLLQHHQITFVVKHLGAYRIAFEIESPTIESLETTLREIRTTFSTLVSDLRVFAVLKEYVANYAAGI